MTLLSLLMLAISTLGPGCREVAESLNDDNDILVRNTAEGDLWIAVDGSHRGRVENNGIAEVVWETEASGAHTVQAFRDPNYETFHCEVQTTFLDGGEDFYWYLYDDDRYGGTRDGQCW